MRYTDNERRAFQAPTAHNTGQLARSLYGQLVAADCKIDNHESDLYVLATTEAAQIVRDWVDVSGLGSTASSTFTSEVDGMLWIEIPFHFEPFWRARARPCSTERSSKREENKVTGYTYCACRDCFEIAIGEDPVMCNECEDAGCEMDEDCQREDAYLEAEESTT